jgi:aryl-alcohol dehydrogenase-like predicted oxidoreductase
MGARKLGSQGPYVGPVGLGCMGLSWAYSESSRDDDWSAAVIESALDHGVTFFDTADVYGEGHNEELVGRSLRRHRHEVTLATKVGLVVDGSPAHTMHRNGTPEHIETAVDASLLRLGDDAIDLYYLHRVDESVPLEESWGAMASLVEKGKVRWLGLAEVTAAQAAEAQAIHPVSAIQSEFSLWTREPQEAVVGWCAANGAAFVPFAPLGRGFLTGAVTASTGTESVQVGRSADQRIVDVVRAVAGRHRATPAQVAIAWVLAQGEHVIPIPGTNNRRYLQENVDAARVALTQEDLDDLTATPAPVG